MTRSADRWFPHGMSAQAVARMRLGMNEAGLTEFDLARACDIDWTHVHGILIRTQRPSRLVAQRMRSILPTLRSIAMQLDSGRTLEPE